MTEATSSEGPASMATRLATESDGAAWPFWLPFWLAAAAAAAASSSLEVGIVVPIAVVSRLLSLVAPVFEEVAAILRCLN